MKNFRNPIKESEKNVLAPLSITFNIMAEEGKIDEITSTEHIALFADWEIGITYTVGALRKYQDKLYRCIQPHTSQIDWAPNVANSLWNMVGNPEEEYPEWSQPIGAHDAYAGGDKVTYDQIHYISTVNNNVWQPGVYGWEATE